MIDAADIHTPGRVPGSSAADGSSADQPQRAQEGGEEETTQERLCPYCRRPIPEEIDYEALAESYGETLY